MLLKVAKSSVLSISMTHSMLFKGLKEYAFDFNGFNGLCLVRPFCTGFNGLCLVRPFCTGFNGLCLVRPFCTHKPLKYKSLLLRFQWCVGALAVIVLLAANLQSFPIGRLFRPSTTYCSVRANLP